MNVVKTDDIDILSQLGRRIAYLRKSKRISQLELSIDSDISKSYLSDLECGRRNPSVMVLSRICAALEITLEELFRGIVPLEQLLKAH
ncbi:MAG: helix-turn-helix transcriptional regulator [Candidatus Enteromonas sp.]|nr:helix-turn-helix transcriptional regulator [Candidatus Enteromonas sp.]MEE3401925.1 helix-turn-helix transcriptional regulator [Candidatus Enteromonas sp.]MEE3427074.1 helix-turn-helix transcriptional regulator [Candidatus Enteromonas sp.]MEE3442763.1 helix-turn-helix transcriptional regulator [Candidatus Enteromonas sp.]MEE3464985.1 helix-turn-helix transcriptional regulator [Candidatus Enteromonas sp.]